MKEYWQEIRALTMRWVRRLSREKFSMLFTLVQPMLFWYKKDTELYYKK